MQLDYNDLAKAVEGGLADAGFTDLVTRYADVAIAFGKGLVTAGPDKSALPSATGFVFDGVAIMKHKAQQNSTNSAQYEANEAISTMRKGRVWVLAEQQITSVDDPVYLRHTANGGTTAPGRFRIDADTSNADLISQARWLTTTTAADELALLEINIP